MLEFLVDHFCVHLVAKLSLTLNTVRKNYAMTKQEQTNRILKFFFQKSDCGIHQK